MIPRLFIIAGLAETLYRKPLKSAFEAGKSIARTMKSSAGMRATLM